MVGFDIDKNKGINIANAWDNSYFKNQIRSLSSRFRIVIVGVVQQWYISHTMWIQQCCYPCNANMNTMGSNLNNVCRYHKAR